MKPFLKVKLLIDIFKESIAAGFYNTKLSMINPKNNKQTIEFANE